MGGNVVRVSLDRRWSKPGGAPFVCIEPWCDYASPTALDGDFIDDEPGMHIAPGTSEVLSFRIASRATTAAGCLSEFRSRLGLPFRSRVKSSRKTAGRLLRCIKKSEDEQSFGEGNHDVVNLRMKHCGRTIGDEFHALCADFRIHLRRRLACRLDSLAIPRTTRTHPSR